MKHAQKLLIVLLALALLVPCIAVFSSATDTAAQEDVTKILEYFSQPVVINEDYESETVGTVIDKANLGNYGIVLGTSGKYPKYVTITPTKNGGDTVLRLDNTSKNSLNSSQVTFKIESGTNMPGVVFNTRVKLGSGVSGKNIMQIRLTGLDVAGADKDPIYVLHFNPTTGKVTYNFETYTGGTDLEGLTLTKDTWYDVTFLVNGATNSFELSITDVAADKTYTAKGNADFSALNGVQVIFPKANWYNSYAEISSLQMYGGTFARNIDASARQGIVEQEILRLDALYSAADTSEDLRFQIIDVIATIVGTYNFTSENAAVNAAIARNAEHSVTAYADAMINGAVAINAENAYADRLAVVTQLDKYAPSLNGGDMSANPDFPREKLQPLKDAYKKYDDESKALAAIKADSDAFNATILAVDAEKAKYDVLSTAAAAVAELKNVDPTYSADTVTALANYEIIKTRAAEIKTAADAFLALVADVRRDSAIDGDNVTFSAFGTCVVNYDNAMLTYATVDETYAGIPDAKAYLTGISARLEVLRAFAEDFINIIESAEFTGYFSAKKEYLAQAKKAIESTEPTLERSFAGVEDAITKYNTLTKKLADDETAAAAYIKAVGELASAKTYAEKSKAVEKALALKEKGNVTGIDGVKEANIALSDVQSEVELKAGYSKKFIALVAELQQAKGLSDRLTLILEAKSVQSKVEDTYTGVSDAKTALTAGISKYNADVKAVNDAFAAVRNVAVNVSEASVTPSVTALLPEEDRRRAAV